VTEEALAGLISIGEFARRSGLSISSLRFYGDAGVLAPAHTDPLSAYRYYSADQLPIAAVIRHLRTAEVPLDQVRALLAAKPADAEARLRGHRTRLRTRVTRSLRALESAQALLLSKEMDMDPTSVSGPDLAAAIRQVLPAAGPCGQEKEYPTAVLFDFREDGLRLAATDGHRLSVRDLPGVTAERGQVTVSAGDAEKVARSVADASIVSFSLRDGLVVQADEHAIRLHPAADDYPNYEAVLAQCGNSKLIVKTADLIKLVDRSKDVVVLTMSRSTTRADEAPFPAEYDGEDLTIGFNPNYLADALEAGIGPDAIFQLGSDVDPAAIRSADEGTLTWMVMPIRLLEKAAAS